MVKIAIFCHCASEKTFREIITGGGPNSPRKPAESSLEYDATEKSSLKFWRGVNLKLSPAFMRIFLWERGFRNKCITTVRIWGVGHFEKPAFQPERRLQGLVTL